MTDQVLGIDYAWDHIDPAAIKAAGYAAVGRYISNDDSKDILPAELAALSAHDLGVWFVFESTADRPLSGAAGGSVDGAKARARLSQLGVPVNIPVFFALDQDPAGSGNWGPVVTAYRDAFHAAANADCAPYGGLDLIDFFKSGWQTQAWSQRIVNGVRTNVVSQYAQIYQRVGHTRQLEGEYDENVILDASVVWWPSRPPVTVVLVSSPAPLMLTQGASGPDVTAMQQLLNSRGFGPLVEDGAFGPVTDAAVRAAQKAYGLTVDGAYGPITRGALLGGAPAAHPDALLVDGQFGPKTISRLQQLIGAAVNGVFGPDARKKLQAWLGVVQDGVVGPVTIKALQARIGAIQDGVWGPGTTSALQTYLNSH